MISKHLFSVFVILSTAAFSMRQEEDVPHSFLQAEVTSEEGASSTNVRQSTEITTDYVDIEIGYWGEWLKKYEAPTGYLGCGMAVRDEGGQGLGDDTALNAVKIIYCSITNWSDQREVELNPGIWGSWKSNVMCDQDFYITGAQVKLETARGSGDDTVMNGLRIRCKNIKLDTANRTKNLEYGGWGDWQSWVEYSSSYVCGGQVRFESDQGSGDDTALNGLRLKFCKYGKPVSTNIKYDLSKVVRNPTPQVLKSATLRNNSKTESSYIFEASEKLTETMKWENMYGVTLGLTITTQAKVPFVGKSEVSVSAETTVEFTRGGETSKEKTLTTRKEIKLEPCKDTTVNFVATKDDVDIPYEATITFEDGSVSTTRGTWHGLVYYNDDLSIVATENSNYCKQIKV